ncbi:MAG TPA: hypothetical protein PKG90_15090 [Chitinophagaceae bacterium]|nr:hypothetical protein [Chitinophagaceae bacterium]HNU15503.1 hypothetical protein [Chitinophagaceae bacterium]
MKTLLQTILMLVLTFAFQFAQSQKGTSIVIHDNTSKANGGENATSNLRSEIESALNREKPCVDIMDDQDIRNVIESEREKNLLEGGDPEQVLKDIGNLMSASYVMSVAATPGAGGSTSYSVFVMNPQTGTTVARQTGTDAKEIAKSIVGQLGSSLADNCKPHWVGEVKYEYTWNETKVTNDAGAAHASTRNTKRTKTDTYSAKNTIVATLLPPKPGSDVSANKTMARVWMRSSIVSEKKQVTNGEVYCRPKGGNSHWTGYNLNYSETVTQSGGGSDNLPVSVSLDNDGNYKIVVLTPSGTLLTKIETNRSESGCNKENPPTKDAQSMPEQKMNASSFDVSGKTDAKNRDSLSGSKTLPDGKTTITWSLRLVKPKEKK